MLITAAWRAWGWTAWWAQRGVTRRSRWLVVTIWGGRKQPWRRVVDWIGMEVLAEIKYWGRLAGCDLRLLME